MSFLAELLAMMFIWLSYLTLGQLGVVPDRSPAAKAAPAHTVSRVPSLLTQAPDVDEAPAAPLRPV
jgi:hypothetical protein